MPKKVKKAVFPVAGLGTRFLPATKSIPKEMLTVVDRPLIHYAFDAARAAGIEEFVFVTGRNKGAIDDYFDHSYELEATLAARNKTEILGKVTNWIPSAGGIVYTRQMEPLGLGHAVWCARHAIGNEPFLVLLPDEMFVSKKPLITEMVSLYNKKGGNILGVADVPREHTNRYGIINPASDDGKTIKIKGMVEKPDPKHAPSNISITGQYILQPEIFKYLDKAVKNKTTTGGEIQLTDAIAAMVKSTPTHAVRFTGDRYDCGNPAGFLKANVALALKNKDTAKETRAMLQALLDGKE